MRGICDLCCSHPVAPLPPCLPEARILLPLSHGAGIWDPWASTRPVGRVVRQRPVQQSEAVSRASAQHAAIIHETAPAECGLCACRAAGWGLEDEPEEPPAEQGQ